jgi:signal transduction histidine kinase
LPRSLRRFAFESDDLQTTFTALQWVCAKITDNTSFKAAVPPMETSLLLRILDVSRRMAEMRAFAPLLNYVVQQAIELVGAERGYLVLPQPDGSLDFRVTLDQQGRVVPHAEDQISRSILKQVVDSGEPLIVRDAVADPQFSSAQSVMALNLRSVMCVPLISYGRAIGAIYVENRSVRNRFKEDDLPPLVLFGHQAAAAIENAALNDDLEARVVARTQELRAANQYLEQSWREATEANRVRTVLLSKITHDIRSPLSLADNTLEAMEIGLIGPLTATQREWLDRARAATARALRLTRDIGQLMNIELGGLQFALEKIDPTEFLQHTYDLARGLRWPDSVEFRLEVEPDLPQIELDPGRIEQVIFNLLSNAIKFTSGGSVTLHAGYDGASTAVIISVTDTGEGIPADQLDKLFQRFQQVDQDPARRRLGSGLGLSICKDLVEMHGGRIWVESTLGAGSSFRFALPIEHNHS